MNKFIIVQDIRTGMFLVSDQIWKRFDSDLWSHDKLKAIKFNDEEELQELIDRDENADIFEDDENYLIINGFTIVTKQKEDE